MGVLQRRRTVIRLRSAFKFSRVLMVLSLMHLVDQTACVKPHGVQIADPRFDCIGTFQSAASLVQTIKLSRLYSSDWCLRFRHARSQSRFPVLGFTPHSILGIDICVYPILCFESSTSSFADCFIFVIMHRTVSVQQILLEAT